MSIMRKQALLSLIIVVFPSLCGCVSETAKQTIEEYNRMFEKVATLEQLVQTTDFSTLTGEEIVTLYNTGNELYYDYNPMDLKEEQKSCVRGVEGTRGQVASRDSHQGKGRNPELQDNSMARRGQTL